MGDASAGCPIRVCGSVCGPIRGSIADRAANRVPRPRPSLADKIGENASDLRDLTACGEISRTGALYQGMTLVVPYRPENERALAPAAFLATLQSTFFRKLPGRAEKTAPKALPCCRGTGVPNAPAGACP